MVDDQRIVQELLQVGVRITGIYDLVNTREKYPEAIPVLIDLVKQEFVNVRIREGIVRALTVKEAKGLANRTLLKIYKETAEADHPSFRWAIGGAFSVIITVSDVPEILQIVRDRENGRSRQMFVMALGKFKKSTDVEETLIGLLDDDQVVLHAINSLRKIASDAAYPKIEKLAVFSDRSVVRKEARKYLDRTNR